MTASPFSASCLINLYISCFAPISIPLVGSSKIIREGEVIKTFAITCAEKLRKQKAEDELIGCTFHPNLGKKQNSSSIIRTDHSLERAIKLYEQGMKQAEKRASMKIPIDEQEYEKYKDECLFKPQINQL